MRSELLRRIVRLETAVFRVTSSSKPVTNDRCFQARVEQRQRITGETFEVAAQFIVRQLADYELQALISELEASTSKGASDDDREVGVGREAELSSSSPGCHGSAPMHSERLPEFVKPECGESEMATAQP